MLSLDLLESVSMGRVTERKAIAAASGSIKAKPATRASKRTGKPVGRPKVKLAAARQGWLFLLQEEQQRLLERQAELTPAEQARLESLSAGILAARTLQRPRSVNWESRIEPIEVLGYIEGEQSAAEFAIRRKSHLSPLVRDRYDIACRFRGDDTLDSFSIGYRPLEFAGPIPDGRNLRAPRTPAESRCVSDFGTFRSIRPKIAPCHGRTP